MAVCGFCKRGAEVKNVCGNLHSEKLTDGKTCAAHHKCMQYSSLLTQYKFDNFGGFKISKVQEEMKRGGYLKCRICIKNKAKDMIRGATAGCALESCRKTFHYYCAHEDETTITKKMVVNSKSTERNAVLYRVFCSQEHNDIYFKSLTTESVFGRANDSDPDDSESDDDNTNASVLSIPSPKHQNTTTPLPKPLHNPVLNNVYKVNGSHSTSKSSITMSPETSPDRIDKDCVSSNNSVSAKESFSSKSESPVSSEGDANGSNILKVEIHKPPTEFCSPTVSASWRSMVAITPLTSTDVENCDTDFKDNEKLPGKTSPVDDGKLSTGVKRKLEPSDDEASTKKHCSSRARSELKNDEEKGFMCLQNRLLPLATGLWPGVPVGCHWSMTCKTYKDFLPSVPGADCTSVHLVRLTPWHNFPVSLVEILIDMVKKILLYVPRKFPCNDRSKELMEKAISERFGEETKAFCWQAYVDGNTFKPEYSIHFITEISEIVQKGRITGLFSQLFNIGKMRIENYGCVSGFSKPLGEKYVQKMERSMWLNIQENLSKAATQHGMEVGSIVTLEDQEAVVICLNHISDNSMKIRDKLTNILFHWNCSTTVKLFSMKSEAQQQEVELIREWMRKKYTDNFRIVRKPEEEIFRIDVPDSDFHRLAEDVAETCSNENGSTAQPGTVVFIGDVDTAIVNYKLFCQKQFKEYLKGGTEELDNFICILSVNPESGIKTIKDFVPGNQNAVDVFSAWDPAVKPISCVVVKLKKAGITEVETSSIQEKNVCVTDSQRASTSGTKQNSRKHRSTLGNVS